MEDYLNPDKPNKEDVKAQTALQKRIDSGEMMNIGNAMSPHWVSKKVWDIVMKASEKYYNK